MVPPARQSQLKESRSLSPSVPHRRGHRRLLSDTPTPRSRRARLFNPGCREVTGYGLPGRPFQVRSAGGLFLSGLQGRRQMDDVSSRRASDGMGCFPVGRNAVLVRNHEIVSALIQITPTVTGLPRSPRASRHRPGPAAGRRDRPYHDLKSRDEVKPSPPEPPSTAPGPNALGLC